MAFVEFEKVSKIYHTGAVEIPALRDATFQVEKGPPVPERPRC